MPDRRVIDRLRTRVAGPDPWQDPDRAAKALLFLTEFEESGKGWFWETDADGALTYVSPSLAETIGRTQDEVFGSKLADLLAFANGFDDGLAGQRSLAFHLAHGLSFTDVTVRPIGDQEVWWLVSGRSVRDRRGRFIGFRGFGTDLTEKRRADEEVTRLAHFDALTGLPNRTMMRRTLERALREMDPRSPGVSVLLMDLDRFKHVNDTLGHPAGDALLRQVAERLTSVIGDTGQVGRLGGDEFQAVLPGLVDPDKVAALADRLISRVADPYQVDGAKVSIGASIGISSTLERGDGADELIRDADLALYAAKASTIQRYRFFSEEMHAQAQERRQLETELRSALNDHGLAVMFQPVVDATSEEIVGFEALLRWMHPTQGVISPSRFVQVAEETGLILRMGEWVLRTACAEAAKWPDHIRIAVNLSPIQFADPSLPSLVMNALAAAELAPSRLELEITESVFLNDGAATDEMFAALKGIGVRFALDDFGTGYSSLGYLRTAPFTKIKIDQSFVRGAAHPASRNGPIIKAIVALASSLGMETTAEGAETHDELKLVRELGCSHVQGYLFGRPVSAEDAFALISTGEPLAPKGLKTHRQPRYSVLRTARLHVGGGAVPVRVRNVSSGGALIESSSQLPSDVEVQLELDGMGLMPGFICWSSDRKAGLRFAVELDLSPVLQGRKPGR